MARWSKTLEFKFDFSFCKVKVSRNNAVTSRGKQIGRPVLPKGMLRYTIFNVAEIAQQVSNTFLLEPLCERFPEGHRDDVDARVRL